MWKQVFQYFLRRFQLANGRSPLSRAEFNQIEGEATNWINKTKGKELPGQAKPDWHTGWNPKVIQGGKKEGIESLLKSGDVKKGVAPKTTPETLKAKKDKHILLRDAHEELAHMRQRNKQAIEDFKKKQGKKTVEEFRDEGDWDPGGMASGGRIGMAIGGFTKAQVLIQMIKNTLKGSKDPYVKKTFPNFIKELTKNPELANDPNVWKQFTTGLPKNQRLVVHSDDSVDFFTQSEFGPHNIEKTLEFQKKHNLSRDQANTILKMEPEDRVLEMKRLETIRARQDSFKGLKEEVSERTGKVYDPKTDTYVTPKMKHADGGRVPLMYGGDPGFAFEYGGSWADWHDQHRDTMPVEQYIQTKLPKERLPFRQMQSGGIAQLSRPGYFFGGPAKGSKALKAIMDAWRANKTWGVGGPPYKPEKTSFDIKALTKKNLGQEYSLSDLKKLESSPFMERGGQTFDQFNQEFKIIKARILKQKLEEAKIQGEAMISSAKQVSAEDATAKKIQAQFTREGKQQVEEATEGLKEIDIYMGMLQKKGRSVHQSGGLAYMLGEPTYSVGGSVGHAPWHKPTGHAQPTAQQETPTPHVAGTPDPLKAPRGIPSLAPKNMDPAYMQQQMMQKAMMGQGPGTPGQGPRPMAAEGGLMRMGFKKGGDWSRRKFLQFLGGAAAIPFFGKYFKAAKLAKPAAAVTETIVKSNAAGMPAWFPSLVKRVLKEGDDITTKAGSEAMERQTVHRATLPSGTPVEVTSDLTSGNVFVDIGKQTKHGWPSGRHGQPTRLTLYKGEWLEPDITKAGKVKGKGQKTKDEFWVEEAEFTGGHPENVKFEESTFEKYGDHASDFTEIEKYAVGKNIDKKIIGKKAARDDWAEGRAMEQAEDVDFAKGGLAGLLGE